jgi:hypothetical protein
LTYVHSDLCALAWESVSTFKSSLTCVRSRMRDQNFNKPLRDVNCLTSVWLPIPSPLSSFLHTQQSVVLKLTVALPLRVDLILRSTCQNFLHIFCCTYFPVINVIFLPFFSASRLSTDFYLNFHYSLYSLYFLHMSLNR